jgi:hypothetical protein
VPGWTPIRIAESLLGLEWSRHGVIDDRNLVIERVAVVVEIDALLNDRVTVAAGRCSLKEQSRW